LFGNDRDNGARPTDFAPIDTAIQKMVRFTADHLKSLRTGFNVFNRHDLGDPNGLLNAERKFTKNIWTC
jgi:hypothetical protein